MKCEEMGLAKRVFLLCVEKLEDLTNIEEQVLEMIIVNLQETIRPRTYTSPATENEEKLSRIEA